MKIIFCFISLLFCSVTIVAQAVHPPYDTDLLSKEFHKDRREKLRKLMPDSSVAVFFSNPERNRSNDVDFQYHQDPNFYYFTGLNDPNSAFIIFKTPQEINDELVTEIIFVQKRDSVAEMWKGKRLGIEGVKVGLGFKTVMYNIDFADFNIDFSKFRKVLTLAISNNDITDDKSDKGDLFSLIKHFKLKTNYARKNVDINFELLQYTSALREVKQPEELVLMRNAIGITCEAQKELMRAIEPGMTEYQSQAIVEYVFKNKGSEYPGYPSILGGGENSCVLHYTSNRKTLMGKNMLVCDAGAEYHGYTADITRTLPVDGQFSEEEKTIYNIVLEAQRAGINACKQGKEFRAPHKAAVAVIQKRLLELGIIKKSEDYLKYFFHGTSHYLGLDVHDAGLYGKLVSGNVITVEPGIYIAANSDCDPKWWDIGIRIEDDILITDAEPKILSDCVPKTIEEIEALMKEESIFNKKR